MCCDLQRTYGPYTDVSIVHITNRLNDVEKTESNCILCVTRGAQIRNSLSRSCIAAFYGPVRCVWACAILRRRRPRRQHRTMKELMKAIFVQRKRIIAILFVFFFFRSSPCKKSVKIRNVDFNRKLWPLSGNKFCTAFDFACRNLYDFIILFFFVYFHSILKHSMFESLNFIILAIARQLTQPSVNIFSFKIRNLCSTIYDHSHTGKTSVARVRSSENSNKKIAE